MILRCVLFAIAVLECPWQFLPDEALADGDILGEIEIFKAAPVGGARFQGVEIEISVRVMRDNGVLRAALADEGGEGAGVDAGKRNDSAMLEPAIEVFCGTEIRGCGDVCLEDRADCAVAVGGCQIFDIFGIGADIAICGKVKVTICPA